MRIFEPTDAKTVEEMLAYFNFCHDGCIRKVSFLKDRSYADDDGITFGWSKNYDDGFYSSRGDIVIEMLLDSYQGAHDRQVISLTFKKFISFSFQQPKGWDYSDIYEIVFNELNDGRYAFSLTSGVTGDQPKFNSFEIVCEGVAGQEL